MIEDALFPEVLSVNNNLHNFLAKIYPMFSFKSLASNLIGKSFAQSLSFQPLRTILTQQGPQRFFMVTYQFKENTQSERGIEIQF